GLLNNNMLLTTEGQSHFNKNTYFGYFAIAFPISNSFGASFGMRPMSNVGYSINTTGNIDSNGTSIGTTNNQYVGSGGINQLHMGLAYSPKCWKNVAVGANLNYLFGYLDYTQNVIYSPNLLAFNSQEIEHTTIHGFSGDFGLMYTIGRLGKKHDSLWQVVLGATVSPNTNLFANYNLMDLSYVPASPQNNIDTVQDSSAGGKIRIPLSFGVGITIIKRDRNNNNMLMLSFDLTWQSWNQYSFLGQNQSLSNSRQMNVGIQWIPHKNLYNTTNKSQAFFGRIHYRLGFSMNQTYLDLNNTPITDTYVSFGLGIPIGAPYAPPMNTQLGVLNFGFQIGELGTTNNNLLREDYAKVLVAFTFNSRWFQKRLYN
ncbi:MAG TPA: hypothetical protein VK890_02935, partial [Bacteroidia bacterium]|nr:hypothetical protein [Bacteroidia bacterium]